MHLFLRILKWVANLVGKTATVTKGLNVLTPRAKLNEFIVGV